MIAIGIDLGGTKIEAQIFDASWACIDARRVETPKSYTALVAAVVDQIAWADRLSGAGLPVGIAAAGLISPATGLAYTANLPAMNMPLPADIEAAVGRKITYINDCRALALSEAVFGAGRGKASVAGLILGTGVGGGLAINGALTPGISATGGEFGHIPAPAHLIKFHNLPVIACGCGRMGCFETLVSGPGLTRMARHFTGHDLSPKLLIAAKTTNAKAVLAWDVWCDLVAELLITLVFTMDPNVIVIGGGMAKIAGLVDDLSRALSRAQLAGFAIPELLIAQGGDASGARGAAYAAIQDRMHV